MGAVTHTVEMSRVQPHQSRKARGQHTRKRSGDELQMRCGSVRRRKMAERLRKAPEPCRCVPAWIVGGEGATHGRRATSEKMGGRTSGSPAQEGKVGGKCDLVRCMVATR